MEKKVIEVEIKSNSESLKKQLKEAQKEVEQLAEKFGATSEQAIKAAKKAAELKDAIGDAKALTDAYNPDAKFNALTESLGGVLNGFQAFEGALGLVGVSSEKVEEALLKVNSAMALAQGLNGVLAARESFANLAAMIGKTALGQKVLTGLTWLYTGAQKALNFVMKQNPVMLIVAGVIALSAAIYGIIKAINIFSDATEKASVSNEKLNKVLEAQDARLEKQFNRLQKTNSQRLAMLEATGATEEQLHKARLKQIEDEDKAVQSRITREKDVIDKKYVLYKKAIAQEDEETAKSIREQIKEREKSYQELSGKHEDYVNAKLLEDAKYLTESEKKIAEEQKQASEKYKAKRDEDLKNLKEYYSDAKKVIEASLRDERENEIAAVDEKYKERFQLAKKYGKDTTDLTIAYRTELNAIETKYDQERINQQNAKSKEQLELLKEAKAKEFELDSKKTLEEKIDFETELLTENYKTKLNLAEDNLILQNQLEETYLLEKAAIRTKFENEEKEAKDAKAKADAEAAKLKKDKEKEEAEARQKAIQNDLEASENAIKSLQSLSEAYFNNKLKKLEKGSKEEEKVARKQFQFNKALMLGLAIIDGAKAVTSSLAQSPLAIGPVPNPIGIASLATAVTTSALQIAKIASMQFQSGGAELPPPSGVGGGGGATPNFNVVGNSTANQLAQIEQKPVQAYVVSNEVTTQQALDRNRQVNATFG